MNICGTTDGSTIFKNTEGICITTSGCATGQCFNSTTFVCDNTAIDTKWRLDSGICKIQTCSGNTTCFNPSSTGSCDPTAPGTKFKLSNGYCHSLNCSLDTKCFNSSDLVNCATPNGSNLFKNTDGTCQSVDCSALNACFNPDTKSCSTVSSTLFKSANGHCLECNAADKCFEVTNATPCQSIIPGAKFKVNDGTCVSLDCTASTACFDPTNTSTCATVGGQKFKLADGKCFTCANSNECFNGTTCNAPSTTIFKKADGLCLTCSGANQCFDQTNNVCGNHTPQTIYENAQGICVSCPSPNCYNPLTGICESVTASLTRNAADGLCQTCNYDECYDTVSSTCIFTSVEIFKKLNGDCLSCTGLDKCYESDQCKNTSTSLFKKADGNCLSCSGNTKCYNSANSVCENTSNSIFKKIDGNCIFCLGNNCLNASNNTCESTSITNFRKSDGYCLLCASEGNCFNVTTNTCVATSATVLKSSTGFCATCTATTQCFDINLGCIPVGAATTNPDVGGNCIYKCLGTECYDTSTSQCILKTPSISIKSDGTCLTCDANSCMNITISPNTCISVLNSTINFKKTDGTCAICSSTQCFDSSSNSCLENSTSNFKKTNGTCAVCSAGQCYDGSSSCVSTTASIIKKEDGFCLTCSNSECYYESIIACITTTPSIIKATNGKCFTCQNTECYDSSSSSCLAESTTTFKNTNGTCEICLSTECYNSTNEVCVTVATPFTKNANGTCQTSCNSTECYDNTNCVSTSATKFLKSDGKCQECTGGQCFDETTESCVSVSSTIFALTSGYCATCTSNQCFDANYNCIATVAANNIVTPNCVFKCTGSECWNLTTSSCIAKTSAISLYEDGTCKTCGANECKDTTKNICVPLTPSNFKKPDGNCLTCPIDECFDGLNACISLTDIIFKKANGSCISCNANECFNKGNNSCLVINNINRMNFDGTCMSCSETQCFDPINLICKTTSVTLFKKPLDGTCVSCTNAQCFDTQIGQCSTITTIPKLADGTCGGVCTPSKIIVDGICSDPINTEYPCPRGYSYQMVGNKHQCTNCLTLGSNFREFLGTCVQNCPISTLEIIVNSTSATVQTVKYCKYCGEDRIKKVVFSNTEIVGFENNVKKCLTQICPNGYGYFKETRSVTNFKYGQTGGNLVSFTVGYCQRCHTFLTDTSTLSSANTSTLATTATTGINVNFFSNFNKCEANCFEHQIKKSNPVQIGTLSTFDSYCESCNGNLVKNGNECLPQCPLNFAVGNVLDWVVKISPNGTETIEKPIARSFCYKCTAKLLTYICGGNTPPVTNRLDSFFSITYPPSKSNDVYKYDKLRTECLNNKEAKLCVSTCPDWSFEMKSGDQIICKTCQDSTGKLLYLVDNEIPNSEPVCVDKCDPLIYIIDEVAKRCTKTKCLRNFLWIENNQRFCADTCSTTSEYKLEDDNKCVTPNQCASSGKFIEENKCVVSCSQDLIISGRNCVNSCNNGIIKIIDGRKNCLTGESICEGPDYLLDDSGKNCIKETDCQDFILTIGTVRSCKKSCNPDFYSIYIPINSATGSTNPDTSSNTSSSTSLIESPISIISRCVNECLNTNNILQSNKDQECFGFCRKCHIKCPDLFILGDNNQCKKCVGESGCSTNFVFFEVSPPICPENSTLKKVHKDFNSYYPECSSINADGTENLFINKEKCTSENILSVVNLKKEIFPPPTPILSEPNFVNACIEDKSERLGCNVLTCGPGKCGGLNSDGVAICDCSGTDFVGLNCQIKNNETSQLLSILGQYLNEIKINLNTSSIPNWSNISNLTNIAVGIAENINNLITDTEKNLCKDIIDKIISLNNYTSCPILEIVDLCLKVTPEISIITSEQRIKALDLFQRICNTCIDKYFTENLFETNQSNYNLFQGVLSNCVAYNPCTSTSGITLSNCLTTGKRNLQSTKNIIISSEFDLKVNGVDSTGTAVLKESQSGHSYSKMINSNISSKDLIDQLSKGFNFRSPITSSFVNLDQYVEYQKLYGYNIFDPQDKFYSYCTHFADTNYADRSQSYKLTAVDSIGKCSSGCKFDSVNTDSQVIVCTCTGDPFVDEFGKKRNLFTYFEENIILTTETQKDRIERLIKKYGSNIGPLASNTKEYQASIFSKINISQFNARYSNLEFFSCLDEAFDNSPISENKIFVAFIILIVIYGCGLLAYLIYECLISNKRNKVLSSNQLITLSEKKSPKNENIVITHKINGSEPRQINGIHYDNVPFNDNGKSNVIENDNKIIINTKNDTNFNFMGSDNDVVDQNVKLNQLNRIPVVANLKDESLHSVPKTPAEDGVSQNNNYIISRRKTPEIDSKRKITHDLKDEEKTERIELQHNPSKPTTFLERFVEELKINHTIIKLFSPSIVRSFYTKLTGSMMFYVFVFFYNALLYNDYFIEKLAEYKIQNKVLFAGVGYLLKNEFSKLCLSLTFAIISSFLVNLIITLPEKLYAAYENSEFRLYDSLIETTEYFFNLENNSRNTKLLVLLFGFSQT